jgi:photosystem II stability/assembly factor-like uncharacterized protein
MEKFLILLFIAHCSLQNVQSQIFWNEVPSGVTVPLNSVSNIDGVNAWACGNNGTVIKTTSSGYNWINVSGNGLPTNVNLGNIYAVSSSIALTAGMIGTNTFVYRTTTSGANWIQVFTQVNGNINGIIMFSTSGVIIGNPVGTRWSIFRTINSGATWDSAGMYLPRNGLENGWNNSVFLHGLKLWFGTDNSRIYYTLTSNINWVAQSTAPEQNSYAICVDTFLTGSIGFAGGAFLLKTTNLGTNWNLVSAPSTGDFSGFAINYQINSAWFIRSGTSIYLTLNPFTNWNITYTAPSGSYTHMAKARMPVFGPGLIYAVRNNGGITRGNFIIEGVKLISNNIPEDYKLYQNYPNPFNPETRIKFNLPNVKILNPGERRGALLIIKVYDALGREIETLVNQITQPGIYEDSWDGSNYPSGIYYYQFTVIDPKFNTIQYRETKKMILLK